MDAANIRFAHALRALRKAKGLTQESLAQKAGIDYKHLQKLESNTPSSPTLGTMEKLAQGLGIPLLELVAALEEEPC